MAGRLLKASFLIAAVASEQLAFDSRARLAGSSPKTAARFGKAWGQVTLTSEGIPRNRAKWVACCSGDGINDGIRGLRCASVCRFKTLRLDGHASALP